MANSATTAARGVSKAPAKPVYTEGYKRLVLTLLVAAYTFNFVDRTIIAAIGQAIKVDLKITDTQLGLLGGLYFALLYTFLGIPLARFAERFSRVNIISGAIVIWSAFTALCGTAGSFAMLGLYRFGVGVGEAGLSPPAHSLISDYYAPKQRASALSVYSFGIPLGTMIGAVLGGYLAQNFSWRIAFFIVGLPGVIIAILIKLLIKEPPRGHSEPEARPALAEDVVPDEPAKPAPTLAREFREMGAVIATLFGNWPVLNIVLGVTLVSFAGYGGGQFIQPYFIRTFHMNYAQVGLMVGLIAGASQGIGTLAGGFLTDKLSRFGARWYALVPAIGITAAYPFLVGVFNAPTPLMAGLFLMLPGLFSYTYLGPSFGVVQNMVPTHRRATATAVLFFFLNLIALGGGPPITGMVIDHLAAFHFAHPDLPGMWAAVQGMFGAHPADFQHACPGGVAPKTAGAAAAASCHGALVLATRQGEILAYGVGLWAALHYLIASFGLKTAMAKARAARGEAD
ncbi:MAG: transporter [Phenylobacterium sp.]|nr:transporter [Phenylobacterium sp.]